MKNLATGRLTQLTGGSATDWEPTWSPDGRSIAFASDRGGAFNIWVKNLATGHIHRLTSGSGDTEYPAWAPDGRRIAFASRRTGTWQIWIKNLASGHTARLARSPWVQLDPSWSPDGRYIAFDSDPHLAFFNIFITPVRGGQLRRITRNPGHRTARLPAARVPGHLR